MFRSYFTIALRSIFKQKFYAFINIFGLAIGICCCLLIISFVMDELSYDREHPEASQTYREYYMMEKKGLIPVYVKAKQ